MKKLPIKAMLACILLITACPLFSCTKAEEVKDEAVEKVDTITTETADAIVKEIKTPINKARATRDLGDQRVEEMNKALQNQ